jgi:hypothetical protein
MEVKQVRDLMEAYASVYSQPEQEVISEDPIQDYRDRKRASENAGGARGPELSHGGPSKGKPQPGSATTKPQPRSREFAREDLQQTVGDVLDTAAKNPVIKAIGNVIAPVGKGRRTVTKAEQERKIKRNVKEESDLFDFILEYLVAEGYADTNQSALVIMANMSEEWRQSIVEADSVEAMRARAAKRREQRYGKQGGGGRDDFRPYTEDDYKKPGSGAASQAKDA